MNSNNGGTNQVGETLYTYFRVDFKDWPEDFDYSICEKLSQVNKLIRMAEIHLDDPDIKTQVIITGIGLSQREYRQWQKEKTLPERFYQQRNFGG